MSRPTSRSGWWHLKVRREGIDRQKRARDRRMHGQTDRKREREMVMRGRKGNETEWDREIDGRIKRERGIVMGAREKERRPRRENCSESPTRILGQTEETRSRRCNGLSLSRSRSYRSFRLDSTRRDRERPHDRFSYFSSIQCVSSTFALSRGWNSWLCKRWSLYLVNDWGEASNLILKKSAYNDMNYEIVKTCLFLLFFFLFWFYRKYLFCSD